MNVAVLGLGEAGSHYANDLIKLGVTVYGYDPNLQRAIDRNVILCQSNAQACENADIIFSVNLSSASIEVAYDVLSVVKPDQFYCEMNTSGPEKKIKIDTILKPSGVQFIDLAIMAPVPPKGIRTPLLASGNAVNAFAHQIEPLHLELSVLENSKVGDAATCKLLRSIVYKGIAAVVYEAMEAGKAYDMEEYIKGQINTLIKGGNEMIDRFIEGSETHALRRMYEMEAVIEMLETKNIDPVVTTGTRNNLKKLIK